jgi:uncharacterized Zn-binding protein involved in type VI secretion
MPKVVRKGDANSAGGIVKGPCSRTVFVNGRKVSLPGDGVSPHPCCPKPKCKKHCIAKTRGGSRSVYIEGKRVIYTGSSDTCGHARKTGSRNVFVGT